MGLPWISYENNIFNPNNSVDVSTEQQFDVGDSLLSKSLYPQWRSKGYLWNLFGDNFGRSSSSDFIINGDVTIEALVSLSSITGTKRLLNRLSNSGGYDVQFTNDEVIFAVYDGTNNGFITTTGVNLVAGVFCRLKCVYDASAQEMSIFKDGVEVARATNSTQTGCTLTGVIPTSITDPSLDFLIGKASGVGFSGSIAFIGIDDIESDDGTYLNPTNCVGYYDFNDADLTDSSGNGNDLTPQGIAALEPEFPRSAAFEYVLFSTDISESLSADTYFIDRRNNISSTATVEVYKSSPIFPPGGFPPIHAKIGDMVREDNGSWLLKDSVETPADGFLFIINDPANTEPTGDPPLGQSFADVGIMNIAHMHLGVRSDLNHSWINDAMVSYQNEVKVRVTSGGTRVGQIQTSTPLWKQEATYSPLDLDDQNNMLAAISAGERGTVPIVLGDDADPQVTRAIYIMQEQYGYINDSITFYDIPNLQFHEIGGGI